MKLHSVRLQNYRKHADLTVDLAADRTLITGPNETGKSTLIEAIHRCLFYRHRSKAAGLQERMQPKTGGDPTVTLEFSLGDTRYTLHKKFRGPTGSQAVLSDDAGGHWEGDPAEEKLQTLLGVDEAKGQQALVFNSQWAHLWVWQGSAQDEPSAKATGSTAQQLREQLQQQGGLGVIASQRDEAVKAAFVRQADELFTKSGKPKKGSRLAEAEQRVSAAQEKATAAEQQWLAGQQAADDLAQAEQTLTEQTRRKEDLAKALVPLRKRQAEANELKATVEQQQQAAEQAAARLQTLTLARMHFTVAALRLGLFQILRSQVFFWGVSGLSILVTVLLSRAAEVTRNRALGRYIGRGGVFLHFLGVFFGPVGPPFHSGDLAR